MSIRHPVVAGDGETLLDDVRTLGKIRAGETLIIDGASTLTGNVTAAGTLAVTGNTTLSGTLTQTGILTPTGGVAAAGGFTAAPFNIYVGGIYDGTAAPGTDTTYAATTSLYTGQIFIPCNMTVTGIAIFNGTNVTTDNVIVQLLDSTGKPVANSAVGSGGTATSGADTWQRIAFTSTYAAVGPASYYIGVSADGTTDGITTVTLGNYPADIVTHTHATIATTAFTVAQTFTANESPVATLY